MDYKPLITTAMAAAMTLAAHAALAQKAVQQVTFDLIAEIERAPFTAKRSVHQPAGPVTVVSTLEDGNVVFDPMSVDLTGGSLHKQMTIVGPLVLKSSDTELPLMAMIGTTEVVPGTPHHVASPNELDRRVKTIRITVASTAPDKPRAGDYTGSVVLLFEPRLDTPEI